MSVVFGEASMRVVTAEEIEAALAYPDLVDVLRNAFRAGVMAPPRHHHTIKLEGDRPDATLLLMPAWTASAPGAETAGRYIGVKTVSVFPGNRDRDLPAVQGAFLLFSAKTGEPLALMDAPRLTVWRTAAASALASRYLSREDSRRLLIVGTGALGRYLAHAHSSVRPIREVVLWNRRPAGARALAQRLIDEGFAVSVSDNLEKSVRDADIISTATLSTTPLVYGEWLSPGTHLDCVGAYRPHMRETDDDVVRRARIWVDTRAGALKESGDIAIPLAAGTITEGCILGDLHDLARSDRFARAAPDDITMFKSVGASIEDLAAAIAVFEKLPAAT
jgi:ornithine cyclodeaminase/alanine dehydrogenase-like protein (mu-crystallin family)